MKPQKLVKVSVNGRKQSPIDLHRTKLGKFIFLCKYYTKKTIKWLCILGIITLAIYIYLSGHIKYQAPETQTVFIDNLSIKVNDLKNKLIADLKEGENGDIVTYDPPKGKYLCKEDFASFGKYQFKVCTVKGYYKKLYNKDITKKEAVLIALDDIKAEELARDIIFKEKGGINNWYNTANKYNLREQLSIINALQ